MDKQDFLHHLEEVLELEPGTLKGDEQLQDLEDWDSLAVMGFISLADEQYGVILSPQTLASCKTVGDLLALVTDGN